MKKDRKLTLHRETLRHLDERRLREAAGGTQTNQNSCDTITWRSCFSADRCPTEADSCTC